MAKRVHRKDWQTFLRIPDLKTMDAAPVLDPAWCALRGVQPESVVVLRLIRDEVLPFVRWLEQKHGLSSYHFLVHDWQSGVPTTEDKGPYIHLRLFFKRSIDLVSVMRGRYIPARPSKWEMTRVSDAHKGEVAGLDSKLLKSKRIETVWRLIDAQAAWVLSLIEAHQWDDDALMLRQVLQYGHYFANMLQVTFR